MQLEMFLNEKMSSVSTRGECQKFTPNIFNKTKCTNCFHQREEHTAEALEFNKDARKISKCGYMFVAPGWDFSDPANRTKRWQRRWFVLYDDGELSYSLDEHPDTVPQASIDMNKVMEVADADEVTGNPYSLAITAPDGVHFVKGTCREEAKWWKEVLSMLLRSKGRHKRNATFPVGQSSGILQQSSLACRTTSDNRSRFKRGHTDSRGLRQTSKWLNLDEEMYPTRDISVSVGISKGALSADEKVDYSSDSTVESDKTNHPRVSPLPPHTREKTNSIELIKSRRTLKKEKRISKVEKEIFCEKKFDTNFGSEIASLESNCALKNDVKNAILDDVPSKSDMARRLIIESEKSKREEKLKDIADSLTKPRSLRRVQKSPISLEERTQIQIKPTRDGECSDDEKGIRSKLPVSEGGKNEIIRGDPDGCGLDLPLHRFSPCAELRVDLPAEDLLNIKKGWLLKQDVGEEWTKHWFVLRGVALMYYRDPAAEDKGILDGVMDMSTVNNVSEIQVQRNYGFQAVSWDDKRYVLSAVTAGIRNNWMAAIRKAAGLIEPFKSPSNDSSEDCDLKRGSESRFISKKHNPHYFELSHSSSQKAYLDPSLLKGGSNQFSETRLPVAQYDRSDLSISVNRLSSCHLVDAYVISSDRHFSEREDAKRSASNESHLPKVLKMQQDDNFRVINAKDDDLWSKGSTPLPPSPPLNRTPISKVKERAKTQITRSRVYNKRSKSSPPSTRRNTLENSRSDEIMRDENSETPIKNRSMILDRVDRRVKGIEELKGQLSLALCERSSAEKELSRLRQRKCEANHQVEELLKNLKVAEDELKLKTQELESFENLKQRYSALEQEHEIMLKSWRESAINDGWKVMYQRLKEEHASDKESWEIKLADVTSMLHGANERCEMLTGELSASEETVEALKAELTNLSERLMRGLEENEGLYGRMRELEGRCLSSSREKGRSVDSLSDLTNIDLDIDLYNLDKERIIEEYEELKGRFEKAIQEIRAMKKELRESHANYDDLELTVINLRQDSKRIEDTGKAQAALMASRIEDLTLKLSASEKQARLLKQKIAKLESRDKRRSLSLRGKESFSIGKETEDKLAELEAKINALESGAPTSIVVRTVTPFSNAENNDDVKRSRLRRKSLESISGPEPMKILLRIFSLERKIANVGKHIDGRFSDERKEEKNSVGFDQDIASKLTGKLHECRCILSSVKSGNQGSVVKTLALLDSNLSDIENLLSEFAYTTAESPRLNLVHSNTYENYVVYKLENLLRSKVIELREKRREILKRNELNREAKLKLMAEKLAYESILIKKIIEAVRESNVQSHYWINAVCSHEIEELNALMTLVARKTSGENIDVTGSGLDSVSKVAAERLYSEGELIGNNEFSSSNNMKFLLDDGTEFKMDFGKLLDHQKSLYGLVECYKRRKLHDIANFLASEILLHSEDHAKRKKLDLKEDKRIREAWSLAQETVNREVTRVEISNLAMRCLLTYGSGKSVKEQEGKLTVIAEKYKRQEDYLWEVEEALATMVDRSINELAVEWEKNMKKSKMENAIKINESRQREESKKFKLALEDLFTVLAQMTIINARINFLIGNSVKSTNESQLPIVCGVCFKKPLADLDLETRFIYFYQKFSVECLKTIKQMEIRSKDGSDAIKALTNAAETVVQLKEILGLPESSLIENQLKFNVSTIQDKCDFLSAELENIVSRIRGELFCPQCNYLKETLHKVESRYREEISMLKRGHEQEMKDLRGELECQKNTLSYQHEKEQALLIERTKALERRLSTLDAEYTQQIDNLRIAYHRTISADVDGREESTEDFIRRRYQAEIEQLRTLCEKGLSAVDNSHRRIIAELEEKHRQELAAAAAEKEQALAEETQATLAALDAMRKAHEMEVQKEINKFKTEFIKKMQNNQDIGVLRKEHEVEMEEIKKEILSLSEKYSKKCVESAALEEQLSHLSKQLSQAQEHIVQLVAKNKELQGHLVSDLKDRFETGLNEIHINEIANRTTTGQKANAASVSGNNQFMETL